MQQVSWIHKFCSNSYLSLSQQNKFRQKVGIQYLEALKLTLKDFNNSQKISLTTQIFSCLQSKNNLEPAKVVDFEMGTKITFAKNC
jgi:7-keto-8-aminopelargonate synthetase-like enzyme